MTTLSATVAQDLVGLAMDGRALNQWQAEVISNDSPEVDCITDHLLELVRCGVAREKVVPLVQLTQRLYACNQAEGTRWNMIAGEFDQLASQLQNQGVRSAMTVAGIGKALRPALKVLRCPGEFSAREIVDASRAVDRVLDAVPESQLFTASVRRELRDTNYQLLEELHGKRVMA